MSSAKKLELLAPARDVDGGRTAVDYGADALYVGGAAFGARAGARNSAEEIARLVEYAHGYNVRVYAALNTLVFDNEQDNAERTARELIAAGVDALIVQDMAYLRMGLTGVEFHASTQMCNTTPQEVDFLAHAGFTRAILERGLTLEEIGVIGSAVPQIELECFVHGAICVGFSGQCYLSRSMSGGRSGNRGDCMQACRLSWDLLEEGVVRSRGKHFLSPLDLDLSSRLADLVDAGVTSFKIEGRLKDDNYVKNIVAHYRLLLDKLGKKTSSGYSTYDFTPDPARSFTRGTTQWMLGDRRGLANFDTPKATGAFVGKVSSLSSDSFVLDRPHDLVAGDGICFVADFSVLGTNVNVVDGRCVIPNKINGIAVGTPVYRSFDKVFADKLAASRTRRTIDVHAVVDCASLTLTDEDGLSVSVALPHAEPARNPEILRTQLLKDGIVSVEMVGEAPFLPAKTANAIRREALGALLQARLSAFLEKNPRRAAVEEMSYPFPGVPENVANRLAEKLYRDHGVTDFSPPKELLADFRGVCVMRSAYCLRREMGLCGKPVGVLGLRHGRHEYRLDFDCNECRMNVVKTMDN